MVDVLAAFVANRGFGRVMIVLGVDPGVIAAGYAVISVHNNRAMLLDYGTLKQRSALPLYERVSRLHEFFNEKIETWHVTDLALETPFLGKNAQNFLKLGYVRGVLYVSVHRHRLMLHEFSPREVKRAITGYGAAQKDQLARVITRLFPGFTFDGRYDTTDAISLALCGLWHSTGPPKRL